MSQRDGGPARKPQGRASRRASVRFAHTACLVLAVLLSSLLQALAQTCSVSGPNASYGTVSVLGGSAFDTTSSFTVSCTGISFFTVGVCVQFSQGTPSGSGTLRYMSGPGSNLVHQLFSDASRTQIWGAWSYGGATAFASGGLARNISLNLFGSGSTTFTVYGRFAGNQQDAVPGTYSWTTTGPVVAYGYGSTSCASSPGSGSDTPGSITWTAIVAADCLVSTTALNFGTIATLTSNVDATGSLTVRCTRTTPYSVSLNNGANPTGSQRRMRLGATTNYISYNLFTDAARTSAWTSTTSAASCTSGAGSCVLGTGTGANQTVTVYGRIPPQATPAIGSYSDTVVVTITF